MAAAVDNLRAIFRVLAAHGVLDRFVLDLTEIHDLGYYTGISFEALAPGLGFRLASGGRYDDLVGHFGPAQPAVGCALWLDRILLARQRQGGRGQAAPAAVLVAADGCPDLAALSGLWRGRGLRVELDLAASAADGLRERARQRGISRIVRCVDATTVVLEIGRDLRELSIQELAREAERWTV